MSASSLRSRLAASTGSFRTAPARCPNAARRYASSTSSSSTSSTSSSRTGGAKTVLYGGAIVAALSLGYLYATDTRAFFHQYLVPRLLRAAFPDAEDAHHVGTVALRRLHELGLHPRERGDSLSGPELAVSVFDGQLPLANPVGISAGLDKDGEIPDALFALGAGVVEIGGCTPRPQEGNPRPRVFRVPVLDGLVNRYGLNSRGADDMALRLRSRVRRFGRELGLTEDEVLDGAAGVPAGSLLPGRLLAVQIAKNKDTDERDGAAVARDYVYCASRLARYADVLVVNVSSPNTPGLRDLQAAEPLTRLLSAVVAEAARTRRAVRPRVMVKVSPDEDQDAQMEGIVRAVRSSGVDGIIVGNTTRRREGLVPQGVRLSVKEHKALMEQGGYSGPAMFERTLDLVGRYRAMLDAQPAGEGTNKRQTVLFATGGITNGEQALKVLNAGASVAMVYTGLVYGGAGTVTRIKGEMKDAIKSR
ncbi:Dihydroorotate dehydrogenase (quinone) [Escovopsis weberi]|uniref:Dihydroorotate dehydrogenase (Quinone) n=1 Tax=Escovopsis weberi TaxID=150374 RepID=A0A0M8NA23_ESCWE|nr:Dihydroorotate dehydrogenase (quinone) [Escovopsis weberi]